VFCNSSLQTQPPMSHSLVVDSLEVRVDMSDPSISIAMCTYNGVKHVLQQMESFAAQSLLPAELVICDDVSRDDTVEVIRAFANRAPFAVWLEVNDANSGYSKNFANAVGLTSGEMILLRP
jgi:glycosyltransferase involved in cell wall biosynthesis